MHKIARVRTHALTHTTELINKEKLNFIFKPCIDMTSLNNNQVMHSQFSIY